MSIHAGNMALHTLRTTSPEARSSPSLKGEMFQRVGTTVEKAHLLVAADRTHSMPNLLDQIGW